MPDAAAGAKVATPAAEAEPFASLDALRLAHHDFREGRAKRDLGKASGAAAAEIRAFIARVRATGAVLADDGDRKAAQGVLDYWSTELASLPGASAADFMPPMLVPFDRTRVAPSDAPATTAAEKSVDDQARELIRLAAAARLWRDSGRQYGYLLLDKGAIDQAARFRDLDPDIAELVTASEAAASRRALVRNAVLIIALLTLMVVGLLGYNFLREQELTEYADLLNRQTRAQLEQARTATEELQKKIDALERQLAARDGGSDTRSTEEVRKEVAQTIRLDKAGYNAARPSDQQLPYQDGFIWIGSDTLASTNLENPTTKAPVLPQDVAVNGRYRVNRSVVFRQGAPSRSDYSPTDSLGVVPAGTVVTALAVPEPAYARPNGNQYWLNIRVERSQAPIVYLQYATASADTANQLATELRERGFQIPGIEATPLAKGLNEVRYFYRQDKEAAEKLARDMSAVLTELGRRDLGATRVIDQTGKRGARNYPGVIELWLDVPARAP